MSSAFVPWLCLLLLALPTSHTGIPLPRANLAEQVNGSPITKTTVTVYYCKNCGRERCKSSDYTDFKIIGKTENEIFSNDDIQLVTNETHITMCLQQENMSRDGTYVIFWEKDGGLGEPCGILKSGALPEDRRRIFTEEGKTCCETEIDHTNPDSVLKCYKTDEKNTNIIDDIIDDGELGDHQYSVGENNQTGLAAALVTLGVCAGAAVLLAIYYFRRRTQKRQGMV
ncbi:uncharacterized protein LOC136048099 [Cyrtonyx montezumae]|uniref:uncharacterized protein LOC136048099 n=1 Tax=Cyrtonyx montezumae TaxID=9017 RepID=UPI0032DA607E